MAGLASESIAGFVETMNSRRIHMKVLIERALEVSAGLVITDIVNQIENQQPHGSWDPNILDYAAFKREVVGETRLLMLSGQYVDSFHRGQMEDDGEIMSISGGSNALDDKGDFLGPILEHGTTEAGSIPARQDGHNYTRETGGVIGRPHVGPAFAFQQENIQHNIREAVMAGCQNREPNFIVAENEFNDNPQEHYLIGSPRKYNTSDGKAAKARHRSAAAWLKFAKGTIR